MLINAKFPGTCSCGAEFEAGARIAWSKSPAYRRGRVHNCPTCRTERRQERATTAPQVRATVAQPDPIDLAYEDAGAAACGLREYEPGEAPW